MDEIDTPRKVTWLLACRDIESMEAPSGPYGDVVTGLKVEFEPSDPPEDDEAKDSDEL